MTIRAVATDIDGTFLTNQRGYDHRLFHQVYQALVKQNVRLIVASGDQYYFLRSLFPKVADQLAFVAENGALTIDRGVEVHCGRLTRKNAYDIWRYVDHLSGVNYVICGRHSAYVMSTAPQAFKQEMHQFYARCREINDFTDIHDDLIFKFALGVPGNQMRAIAHDIDTRFAGVIRATASGYGAIDLIIPGLDKSYGLKLLLDRWQLAPQELAVFGDGENDLEMFNLAGISYAMGNAPTNVQAAATQVIGTNNEQAVLHQLAKLFVE